ncbi:MAG: hypothetical protein ACXWL2_01400 [Candidatus Chromulinivorax sp.]
MKKLTALILILSCSDLFSKFDSIKQKTILENPEQTRQQLELERRQQIEQERFTVGDWIRALNLSILDNRRMRESRAVVPPIVPVVTADNQFNQRLHAKQQAHIKNVQEEIARKKALEDGLRNQNCLQNVGGQYDHVNLVKNQNYTTAVKKMNQAKFANNQTVDEFIKTEYQEYQNSFWKYFKKNKAQKLLDRLS